MPLSKKKYVRRFTIWRYRATSNKHFIYVFSVVIGLASGFLAVSLRNVTFWIEKLLERGIFLSQVAYFILPSIGLLLVYVLIKFVFKTPVKHGIPFILHSLSNKKGVIPFKNSFTPLVTAPLTVGFGGSVGLLGPAVASGSVLGASLGKLFRVAAKTRILLIGCASAAAISSIFKSPIAGIIFAIEVFSLDLTFGSLIPLLLASVSSVITSYFFMGDDLLFDLRITEKFAIADTPFFILLGIGTGIASVYFSKIYFRITGLFSHIKTYFKRLLVGGILIGVLLYLIPPLYGEGFGFIRNLLEGNDLEAIGNVPFTKFSENIWIIIGLLFGITVFKAVAMSLTFAAGGSGGIFIPTMVMGSALGNVIAKLINHSGLGFQVSEANFTLVGMAGLIAGVLHAPLTAIFLIAEISGGYHLFIPLMLSCAISFLITKNTLEHTIYTKELAERGQLLTHNKDQTILTLMKLDEVIENDFVSISIDWTLGEMLHKAVTKSSRNIFPVVSQEGFFEGVVLLDDIRSIMFDEAVYDSIYVKDLLHGVPAKIQHNEQMKSVMQKFQETGTWNLPVLKNGKYIGFVSKSKLLTAYRRNLINFSS